MLKAEKRNFAKTFTLELYACEFCELCVQVCPTDAIIMMKSFDLATGDRRELLLDKDRLHALGLQFQPSWATGNRLRDMQAPPKAPRARGESQGRDQGVRRVTGEALGFWGVAVVLLASSLGVVLTKNLFHAVLYLAAALVATGIVFLLLDSPFLFAVQLLLYAGGVVTIVVFAIMLTERLVGETLAQSSRYVINGAIVSAAVFAAIAGVLLQARSAPAPRPPGADTTAALGQAVLGPYALSFVLLAILLVAALIGALYFARADD